MNIFLFGATGGTGKEILLKLLAEKHQVFVVARNPMVLDDAIKQYGNNLKVVKGNIYEPDTYHEAMNKCDLVISALGTGTSRKPTEIYSKGGQEIISAMQKANKKRLITLTAAAFDPADPQHNNLLLKFIVRPLFKNIYSDMQEWENILENSKDIDWTIIRPSRLTSGKEQGNYRVEINHCPQNGGKICRKDVADFITKQINSDRYIHKKVAIAY